MTSGQRVVMAMLLIPVGLLAGTDTFELMGNMQRQQRCRWRRTWLRGRRWTCS